MDRHQTEKEKKELLLPKDDNVQIFIELFDCSKIAGGSSTQLFQNKFQDNIGLMKQLKVDPEKGLNMKDTADIKERKAFYGNNYPQEEEEVTFMDFVWGCLEDRTLRILLLAALVSLIIGIAQEGLATGWIEGTAIFFAVFIVVTITAINNWSKDRQFQKLNKETKIKFVFVKREGIKQEINANELLVGDLMYINIGDIVNVDGVLIEGAVSMDESAATGESDLLKKTTTFQQKGKIQTNPFILSGTQTKEGEGIMVVCAVGENTFSGISKKKLGSKDENSEVNKTPLELQLEDVAEKIDNIGFIMAIIIGLLMVTKEVAIRLITGKVLFTSSLVDTIINAFIISVTVIVVAIPEGLPMAVTISLAFSVFKMKEEKNLVRHLEASETMGSCNNICTDKTGTLTEGKMSISHLYIAGKDYDRHLHKQMSDNTKSLLSEVLASNMTVHAVKENGVFVARGNMTECALLQFLIDSEIKYELKAESTPAYRLPFSSEYKYMVTIWEQEDGTFRMYVKGAPERLFDKASSIYSDDGDKEVSSEIRSAFEKQQEYYASQRERTLVIGFRDFTIEELNEIKDNHPEITVAFFDELLSKQFQILALLGIADQPRAEVPQAIKTCREAGLTVRMVTGDNIKTAIAIAKKVNILSTEEGNMADKYCSQEPEPKGKVDHTFGFSGNLQEREEYTKHPIALEGVEFRMRSGGYTAKEDEEDKKVIKYRLNDEDKFRDVTKNLVVIARASPDDKFLLVMGLKQIGNTVAVTGDGTNDAPALKQSDVGFAMGIRGTDIAKDASDIILLNDSFSSVVTAIKYGRNVYDCIRKFIQFQLTTNVVAVFMTLLGGIILKDSPLNAIQMLWVNLIMDSFASLALATEPPTEKLLQRNPYPKKSSIITTMMLINIVSQAIFQIIVLTVIIFYGDVLFGVPSDRELSHFEWNNVNGYHFTLFFNIFVFMQVFNSINARKLTKREVNVFEGIFNNYLYIVVQLIIVVGQVLMVTLGGRALRTQPLSLNQHLACIAIGAFTLVVSFCVKQLPFHDEEEKAKEMREGLKRRGTYEHLSRGMSSRIKSRTKSRTLPTKSK